MSEQVSIVGTLKPFFKTYEGDTKSVILQFCKDNSLPIDENDVLESWYDNYSEKYFVYKNTVYEIIKKVELNSSDIFEASLNKQDQVEFILSYYNGGCSFTEALETALEKL